VFPFQSAVQLKQSKSKRKETKKEIITLPFIQVPSYLPPVKGPEVNVYAAALSTESTSAEQLPDDALFHIA